jgi:serine/threonine protein kinase
MLNIPDSVPWTSTGRTVGSGGQSEVHEVIAKEGSGFPPGAHAMKILGKVESSQAHERFRREIVAIQRISDPRIVRVVDFSKEQENFKYYVMPLYGEEYLCLNALFQVPELPFVRNPKACLEFIASCADALHMVHEADIIHRDLQPRNILVNRKTLQPIILDFGCCQMEGDETITLTDEGVGTPNYMAPECEHGPIARPTHQSDVYSLGKILWSMVTGRKAFARENPAFTSCNLATILPRDPDTWHLTRIFEHTIRRDPEQRYRNAAKLAEDALWVAHALLGRYPPLELVDRRCPVCGQAGMVQSSQEYLVGLLKVLGNPMPQGTIAQQCTVCGHLTAWDIRPIRDREIKLEKME